MTQEESDMVNLQLLRQTGKGPYLFHTKSYIDESYA